MTTPIVDIGHSAIADRGDLDVRFRELVVSVADHGAATSLADNADAFDDAHAKALSIGAPLYLPPGTWKTSRPLRVDTVGGFTGAGRKLTTIQPTADFDGSALIEFGADEQTGSARTNAAVGGFFLDNTGRTIDGLVVYKAQNLEIFDIYADGCRYGVFFDGQYDIRVLGILLRNIHTRGAVTGYRFEGPAAPQSTSFDSFTMLNCSSESDDTGVYISGTIRNHLAIVGGEIQASTVAGVHSVGGYVRLLGTYIETATPGTVPSVKAEAGAVVVADASANVSFPSVDSTSVLLSQGGVLSGTYRWNGNHWLGARDGERDGQGWGPPSWPSGKTGYTSYRGQVYRDSEGVDWTCTVGGVSTVSPRPRWAALGGEIRIPVSYDDLTDGADLWLPEEDFVCTDIDLLVTTKFEGGTSVSIGNASTEDFFISATQGAITNLTAGKLLSARRNPSENASDLASAVGRVGMSGGQSAASAYRVRWHATGTFTAGAGLIAIRGYYLVQSTRGGVTDEAAV